MAVTIRRDQKSPSLALSVVLYCFIALANAGFLCDFAAVLSVTIKERLYITIVFFLLSTTDFSYPPPSSPIYL
jgi:hypothetical protein